MTREQFEALIENEPSRVMSYHNGYIYYIRRQVELLHYCGYVYVPSNHPILKDINDNDYSKVDKVLDMHGGCTYVYNDHDHIVIGLDCGHNSDLNSLTLNFLRFDQYRDYTYVLDQVYYIIDQIVEKTSLELQKKYEKEIEVKYAKMLLRS